MLNLENFLTKEEEQQIVEAIQKAEKETSGEIRVHIEKTTSIAALDRAVEVFNLLNMHQTALKNGVLFYLAVDDKAFAICGDKGIDEVVPSDFWDSTKEVMMSHFKNGDFKQGLIDGIHKAGKQLQSHFPCAEDDKDELSNEISRG
ncbi:TPM domain-containing protein [Flavobacterium pallidum]|uniref:TPM domain-containing protein n=1 Tax=Flavobacterium pallidum TaxID=2172098 RepID=A0A2S1SDV1_9FLAO|nr:TPM domain-containing protein [Flavobacterium pallidum]AWI24578.1 hypothetical protein HYN49_00970 [Flavobacterium pallidum]